MIGNLLFIIGGSGCILAFGALVALILHLIWPGVFESPTGDQPTGDRVNGR
jgi:hypothetical protein